MCRSKENGCPTCEVCGKTGDVTRCSGCKCVYYCGVEHQREDRKAHKYLCRMTQDIRICTTPLDELGPGQCAAAPRPPAAQPLWESEAPVSRENIQSKIRSGWRDGLSLTKQREWLIDCYRVRVDEDYARGGGNMHGLYALAGEPEPVIDDFLVFCKLVARRGVVTPDWDWAAMVACSMKLIIYAFEESDAEAKYGCESVFNVMMGGRSLTATAEEVYGCGVTDFEMDELHRNMEEAVGAWADCGRRRNKVFREVGGGASWRRLYDELELPGGTGYVVHGAGPLEGDTSDSAGWETE